MIDPLNVTVSFHDSKTFKIVHMSLFLYSKYFVILLFLIFIWTTMSAIDCRLYYFFPYAAVFCFFFMWHLNVLLFLALRFSCSKEPRILVVFIELFLLLCKNFFPFSVIFYFRIILNTDPLKHHFLYSSQFFVIFAFTITRLFVGGIL